MRGLAKPRTGPAPAGSVVLHSMKLMAQTADEIEADVLIVSEPVTRYGHEDW